MPDFIAPMSPSPENWTLDKLTKLFGDDRRAGRLANRVNDLLQYTPMGVPQMGYDAGKMISAGVKNRSIPQAGMGFGMAALGMVPMARGLAPEIKQGIKAYHGSPHMFDKFDASKIGTGEGAQVYGHGLYFAEHPDTATAYRDALKGMVDNPARNAKLKELAKAMENETVPGGGYRKFKDQKGHDLAAEYDRIMQERADDKGHMYEVNINANPDHFLDWDKPLSEMSPEVQQKLHAAMLAHKTDHAYQTGGQIYRNNTPGFVSSGPYKEPVHAAASRALSDAGIPGIKYLDQGSRTAGDGTRNYVVFNPDMVNILRRYALPVSAGGAMAGAALGAPQMQPQY